MRLRPSFDYPEIKNDIFPVDVFGHLTHCKLGGKIARSIEKFVIVELLNSQTKSDRDLTVFIFAACIDYSRLYELYCKIGFYLLQNLSDHAILIRPTDYMHVIISNCRIVLLCFCRLDYAV